MILVEPIAEVDEPFLAFVRTLPCSFCARPGPSDPSHLVPRGWREPRRDDRLAVPHCRRCHDEWHALGPSGAMARHDISAVDLVRIVVRLHAKFYALDPDPPL
ncbi:MAG: hypothetical protein L0206_01030 [Actinobacteria bacterium]|nr:hypothetical protein [Actinomycetota bacterium]